MKIQLLWEPRRLSSFLFYWDISGKVVSRSYSGEFLFVIQYFYSNVVSSCPKRFFSTSVLSL